MKVSLNWLKEYVEIGNDYQQLADKFNLMSQEVEALYPLVEASHLVIGKVLTCLPHPNADKLSLTTVDVGDEVLQIICGAPNVKQGQKVIVAKVGAVLPGNFKIKKTKIRGVESVGMICSLAELGVQDFDEEELGIYVLGDDAVIGENPLTYLNLDDTVLELDLTANRPDLLSVEGVAYDVACMLDKPICLKQHHYDYLHIDNQLEVFTDTSKCDAYYGQVIHHIQIKESPSWMKARLLSSGIRPINNVVDITNYVMLEYGQPLHAFDYDRLQSPSIIVRRAKDGETFTTLDHIERKLVEEDIVITNQGTCIALAGVMGGLDTEVSDSTTKILLEAASFNPISVRKTSKRLNLKSESSTRFEKGIDPNKIKKAMDYATELFINLAGGEVVGRYSSFDNTHKKPHTVTLTLEQLYRVTGYAFTRDQVENVLHRLRFNYSFKDTICYVEVPTRRQGVYGYQDIIEEIVRIFGYNNIPTTLPITPTFGYVTKKQNLRRFIKDFFVQQGFSETVTYSLVSNDNISAYDTSQKSVVEIINPLHKGRAFMRHSLLPSLLDVVVYNKSRKMNDIFLFEMGRGYTQETEYELLSGVMHGLYQSTHWLKQTELSDFYLLKGILENLLRQLRIDQVDIIKTKHPLSSMHPGIHADLYIQETYIGFLGRLHPKTEQDLHLNETFVFELNIDLLSSFFSTDMVMESIPVYPSVTRDLALVMDESVTAKSVVDEIKTAGKGSLKHVEIFDLYRGEHIEDSKKSMALTLRFQNPEKTLEAEDVDIAITRILNHLERVLNAKIR